MRRCGWGKNSPHSEDLGAPVGRPAPAKAGRECEYSAGGVYCGIAEAGVGNFYRRAAEGDERLLAFRLNRLLYIKREATVCSP